MAADNRPRVLCVDDEQRVLLGLSAMLRRDFDVTTAESPTKALALLSGGAPFAVIVSDMRMPEMNGAALLARCKAIAPDTVRILLTGQVDFDIAITAVNEGSVFRFLRKPCEHEVLVRALRDGVDQHRLVTAERELLERTLRGTVEMLMDVLAIANPTAFGNASRIRRHVAGMTNRLAVANAWEFDIAAMLLQLGSILLSPETIGKLYQGLQLNDAEVAALAQGPRLVQTLVQRVPRLDGVKAMIAAFQTARERPLRNEDGVPADRARLGGALLRLATDFDRLESRLLSAEAALKAMEARPIGFNLVLLAIFKENVNAIATSTSVRTIPFADLRPGMVLAEDLRTTEGVLLARKGYEVPLALVQRARSHGFGNVREPVLVLEGHMSAPQNAPSAALPASAPTVPAAPGSPASA